MKGKPRSVLTEITKAQWKTIEDMARDMCTNEMIADYLGISTRTLYAPHIKPEFERITRMRRAKTRWEVLANQKALALKGQPVGSIWWGKQHLDQRDKQEHTGKDGNPLELFAGAEQRLIDGLDRLASRKPKA